MATTVTLRRWQRDALIAFSDRPLPDFMAVACPGAGKTTFALAAIRQELGGTARPVAVTVPTAHLKRQWAEAAHRFGLHLDPDWDGKSALAADMHGVVVTYAQAASAADQIARQIQGGVVVLDEVHHAANDKTWGDGVARAFSGASVRLLLSGTPFRSDDSPIPFVRYTHGDWGEAVVDFEYGYGDALSDGGVVRPVYFPRFDGHMEWTDGSGALREATFADELNKDQWSARLRTALDVDGEWITAVLARAHRRLESIRESHPEAGGLVIATDQEHARGIASRLESLTGSKVTVALSEDPKSSDHIESFAHSEDRWVVAVRMISEGVDIPRLRVAVFATTTTTPLFFRQAVGRIARWVRGVREQPAYFFVPDDHRLRGHAANIAVQRRHAIGTKPTGDKREPDPSALDDLGDAEQMNLFAALSSTVLDESMSNDGLDPNETSVRSSAEELIGHPFELPPPPPLAGRSDSDPLESLAAMRTTFADKKDLRDRNSDRVRTLVSLVGMEHRAVNAELNRRAKIDKITEATASQLQRRLEAADAWLEELTGR